MGANHSCASSQKREVAVGVIQGAGYTESRREVEDLHNLEVRNPVEVAV